MQTPSGFQRQELIEIVRWLERDVGKLRAALASYIEAEALPAASPAPPQTPALAPPPPPPPPPRPAETWLFADTETDRAPGSESEDVEERVVGTWFARIGAMALVGGAGSAFAYAVQRGWIGP